MTFGGNPARVPCGFVERLRDMADGDGHVAFEEDLQAGDAVRIVGGPFDDLCGSLAGAAGSERVVVLLQLLSGETKVTLPRGQLSRPDHPRQSVCRNAEGEIDPGPEDG